jgi:DNA-directed RNA polymerase specialized sigma24 family protein
MPSADATDLDVAAFALVLALDGEQTLDATTLGIIQAELTRRARSSLVPVEDLEDLVDAVLLRFIAATRGGGIRPELAGGYLARSVRNASIDLRRSRGGGNERQPVPFDEERLMALPIDDDALSRMLAAHAARTDVLAGLARAVADERFTVVQVVTQWLELAELTGEEPSSRRVGFALDLSHTTVNNALQEFRERYLPQAPAAP